MLVSCIATPRSQARASAVGVAHAHQQRHHRADRAGDAGGVGVQRRRASRSGGPSASHAKPSSSASGSARGMREARDHVGERAVGRRSAAACRRRPRPAARAARPTASASPRRDVDRVVGQRGRRRRAREAGSRTRARQQQRRGVEGPRAVAQQRAAGGEVGASQRRGRIGRGGMERQARLHAGTTVIEDAGRGEHAGQAGAGMGAGADEVEAVDLLAPVVRPEPGALRQHRLEPEGGAAERRAAGPGNPAASAGAR